MPSDPAPAVNEPVKSPPEGARTQPADDRLSADRAVRRKLLKAAIGGAAAGAVFVAPRVESFSLAPDYAAASSCAGGDGTDLVFNQTNCMVLTYCWGNTCCGAKNQNMTIDSRFVLSFTIDGTVVNNGKWSFNLNGIDPPWQSCRVNVSGTCAVGGYNGGYDNTFTNNASGISDNTATCGSWPSGNTVTVKMSCVCV